MSTSRMIKSRWSALNLWIACEPSCASMTVCPIARSWSPSAARKVRESSAIRMRMPGPRRGYRLLDPAETLDGLEDVGFRDDADDLAALVDGQTREVLLRQHARRFADRG